jgi:hypothetical protein
MFYREHIEPNMRDWEDAPLEQQRAMNLAVSLNQMADHFWHSFGKDPGKVLGATDLPGFRRTLSAQFPEFALVRDVADAHKHFILSRADRKLTDASQATAGSMGWGEAQFGVGQWGSPAEIVVTYDDGTKHHFSAAVRAVRDMWKMLLP